jgi:hypothetical protein
MTAHGGLIVWSQFLCQKKFRQQLREVLPYDPTSPDAYDPTDVALGYVGGIMRPCRAPCCAMPSNTSRPPSEFRIGDEPGRPSP